MLVPLAAAPAPAAGTGSVSLTAVGVAASEPFDSLAISGTTNTTLAEGWYLRETGRALRTTTSTPRAPAPARAATSTASVLRPARNVRFGGLQSGSLNPTVGAAFTNNTGTAITRLDIAYTGEQWRLGALAKRGYASLADPTAWTSSTASMRPASPTARGRTSTASTSPARSPKARPGPATATSHPTAPPSRAASRLRRIAPGATVWMRWTDLNVVRAPTTASQSTSSASRHGSPRPRPRSRRRHPQTGPPTSPWTPTSRSRSPSPSTSSTRGSPSHARSRARTRQPSQAGPPSSRSTHTATSSPTSPAP